MIKHARHVCLACSGVITPEQTEEGVRAKNHGKTTTRYRHANDADCRAELTTPSPYRIPVTGRHTPNLPGLDEMEKWD